MQDQRDHEAEDRKSSAPEAALYAFFERHAIAWRHHDHPPLFTVEESRALRGDLPGAHVKNLFLKEKTGALWLVTCLEDRRIRIRDLEREIGAKNTSFAKPELLREALGVSPGAVTPFAVIKDPAQRVRVVLDRAIPAAHDTVNAHPLHNAATTAIATTDLVAFLERTGHPPLIVDFDALEAKVADRERAR